MRLIFVRHGQAEGHFSLDQDKDFLRELTEDGIKDLHRTFKSFKKAQKRIDVIFTSPLARAVQSAEILWEHWTDANLEMMADLDILDDPAHLVEYISFLPNDGTYAFVGHDPHLTRAIASILSLHPEHDFLSMKKGGICVLQGGMWEGFTLELLLSPKSIKTIRT
ncbi:MAG: phosphohistidine phosphatase SixA [Bacteriovoracaceae bacterium]